MRALVISQNARKIPRMGGRGEELVFFEVKTSFGALNKNVVGY
jgi:hypothetical protein